MSEYYYKLSSLRHSLPNLWSDNSAYQLSYLHRSFLEIDRIIRDKGLINIFNGSTDIEAEIKHSQKRQAYFTIARNHIIGDIDDLSSFF